MDTARYRAFLTAAETGSFRHAADVLGYTPSGVSQLIQALEKELSIPLFHRRKKGVSLTSSGEILLPVVQKIVAQENHLLQLSADINGMVTGTINVAAYHSLASSWMPEVFSSFQKSYPQVRINLFEGTQQDIIGRLKDGTSDVAFFNDSAMTGEYDWIPLINDPMLAVVPADHPMAGADKFPISKFQGERFIMPEHGYDYDVLRIMSQRHVTPDIYLSTFDSYIVLQMVAEGLGISMVNGMCVDENQHRGKLAAIPLDPPEGLETGIAVMSLKSAPPAVRKFVEHAERVIRQMESNIGRKSDIRTYI